MNNLTALALSDPWLETEYQSVFAESVDIYFTSALANN
jgi:hypothetical protein